MPAAGYANPSPSPPLNLFFDIRSAPFFVYDQQNYIYYQTSRQLPAMQSLSLFDVYLSSGHSIEPHWHPNANELIYMIQGEIVESVFNPYTKQVQSYRVRPQQTVYIPMGWWHWTIAMAEHTHFTASFDNPAAEIIYGSDVLRLTPPEVFQLAYGIDSAKWAETISPIRQTVVIGPPRTAGMFGC